MSGKSDSRPEGTAQGSRRSPPVATAPSATSTDIISRFLDLAEPDPPSSDLPVPRLSRRVLINLGKDLAEAERVLVHQKEFLESIVDNIADGLFVLTVDLKIVKVNAALVRLLQCKESDLLGEPLDILFDPGNRPLDPIDHTSSHPDRWEAPHTEMVGKGGERIPVSFRASVIRGRDGRFLGVLGTVRDIRGDLRSEQKIRAAERRAREAAAQEHDRAEELGKAYRSLEEASRDLKRTQEQLVQSEKLSAVGSLVAGVAHELNNPLTGVLGFSQLLLMGDCGEGIRQDLKKIHREAQRCQKIVQNLLRFSRQTKPRWERVHVNQAIEQILELRAYELRNGDVTVVRELDPTLPEVMGDTQQLQQVFLNIINNAVDSMTASGERGTLTVRTESMESGVRITLADSGKGVPAEFRNRVFDPFFTTKEVGKGTGLGLSVSHGIVAGHGGEIRLIPSEVGAAFQIDLPLHQGKETVTVAPPEVDPALLGTCRILIVDDEEAVLDVMERLLGSDGHDVTVASSVGEALGILDENPGGFDVLLSDFKMPDMDGSGFYRHLEESHPELLGRIVFVTGDGANRETHRFLEGQGCLYINKPFTLEEFRRVLSRSLRTASAGSVPTGEIWVLDGDPDVARTLERTVQEFAGPPSLLRMVEDADTLQQDLRTLVPELLLVDIGLQDPPGLDLVRQLKRTFPDLRLVALCHYARRREAERALAAGAEEYLLKPIRGREASLILEKILPEHS